MTYIAIGRIQHSGKMYESGAILPDLEEKDEARLLELKLIQEPVVVAEKKEIPDTNPPEEMTIEELKQYLETAEIIDDVEDLLEAELAKPDPRSTAVKLLEKWLQDADEEDTEGGEGP